MANVSQTVYNAFRKWAVEKYGSWAVFSQARFTFSEFQKSVEYQEWLKTGDYANLIKTQEQEEFTTLQETKGPYYKSEYPTIDTLPKLDPSFEYVLQTFDPKTGTVLPDPEWIRQKKVAPPETLLTPEQDRLSALIAAGIEPTWAQKWEAEHPTDSAVAESKRQFDILQAQRPELQRQQNELQFEKDRQDLINGLPSNDWVRRYFVENQPNPYKVQETKPVDQLETQLDTATADYQSLIDQELRLLLAKKRNTPEYGALKERVNAAKENRDALYNVWKTAKEENEAWTPQNVPPIYPNAPSWLPYYVPGVTAGSMITPQEVPTPSGQQLTAMPTSLLESLASYSKWAGGQMWRPLSEEVRRITEASALMQPETPFSRTRWSPAGARV